jgi:hypothetical protein
MENKRGRVLVYRYDIDLIISEETIHQREYFIYGTIVDNLVNEGGRKVVFRTSFINVPIINSHVDRTFFLVKRNKIGNPVS